MPWYTVWAAPTAALRVRDRLSWFVAIQGAVVTSAFILPPSSLRGGSLIADVVQLVVPAALAAVLLWAVIPVLRRGHGSIAEGAKTAARIELQT